MPQPPSLVWSVTTGEAGNVSQASGLAHALGLPVVTKVGHLPRLWSWLPSPIAARAGLKRLLGPGSDAFSAPWPDVVVACGRRAAALSLAIRAQAPSRPFLIQLLDPQVSPRHFDLVVAPHHDGLTGKNVLPTLGALHRLTPERLATGAATFGERFAALPRPLVAVLIGGASGTYCFDRDDARRLAADLAGLIHQGHGLVITMSRRTGPDNAALLRETLTPLGALIWDGSGPNPYDAMLALADTLLVTEDSVSMISEACFTGKPVEIIRLGGGSPRFTRFHQALENAGHTRPFTGVLTPWRPGAPLDETTRIATLIRERLALPLK